MVDALIRMKTCSELTIAWYALTNKQALESAVRVPNSEVTVLGGLIREDNGAKKERLILLQPVIR